MERLISFLFVAFLAEICVLYAGFPFEVGLFNALLLGTIAAFGGEKVFYGIVRAMRFVK